MSLVPFLCMAVETECLNTLSPLGGFGVHSTVTRHAGFIFLRKGRKLRTIFMAGPALVLPGDAGFEFSYPVFSEPSLVVRPVATDAIGILCGIMDFFPAVSPLLQIRLNLIVTGKTPIRRKKISTPLVHIGGIRMECLVRYAFMAVLA